MEKLKALFKNKFMVIGTVAVILLIAIVVGVMAFPGNIASVFRSGVTVTFDKMDGSAPVEMLVDKDKPIAEADLPDSTRSGYIFQGWAYLGEPDRILTAEDVFTENTSLFAIYISDVLESQNAYMEDVSPNISFLVETSIPVDDSNITSVLMLEDTSQTGIRLKVTPEGEYYRIIGNPAFLPGYSYALTINDPKGLVFRGRRNPHKAKENLRVCRRWHYDRTNNKNHRIVRAFEP